MCDSVFTYTVAFYRVVNFYSIKKMKHFSLPSVGEPDLDYVLLELGELGFTEPFVNYEAVMRRVAGSVTYQLPSWTNLRSRLKMIEGLPVGVPINILISKTELKLLFRNSHGGNTVRSPQEPLEDTLFPVTTLWILGVK